MSTIVRPAARRSPWEAACQSAAIIAREAARDRRAGCLTQHGRVLVKALAAVGIDLDPKPPSPIRPPGCSLTDREFEVLIGMGNGKSNADIGRELYVCEDTIKTHARRIYRKLDARDRAHAVANGFRLGILR